MRDLNVMARRDDAPTARDWLIAGEYAANLSTVPWGQEQLDRLMGKLAPNLPLDDALDRLAGVTDAWAIFCALSPDAVVGSIEDTAAPTDALMLEVGVTEYRRELATWQARRGLQEALQRAIE